MIYIRDHFASSYFGSSARLSSTLPSPIKPGNRHHNGFAVSVKPHLGDGIDRTRFFGRQSKALRDGH